MGRFFIALFALWCYTMGNQKEKRNHPMTLEFGRPATNEGRLDKEIRCYDLLDSLGVDYQRIDHDPNNNCLYGCSLDSVI